MATLEPDAEFPRHQETPEATLQPDALHLKADTVVGLAATGPAYSLTVALVPLALAVGAQAPAALLLAFVPTMLIAIACMQLNRSQPDCGTTFIWSARAFGAFMGWLAAWALWVTNVIVMANMAQIAGEYSFRLAGVMEAAASGTSTLAMGIAWIVLTSWLSYLGIELSVRAQSLLLGIELAALACFAVYAMVDACGMPPTNCRNAPILSWFDPTIPSPAAMAKGVLVATFLYWGWDTAFVVNEESVERRSTPGRAALLAMLLLMVTYMLVTVAAVTAAGVGAEGAGLGNAANGDDALLAIARQTFGGFGSQVLVLAVLASTIGAMQATVLAAARLSLSMARLRACPRQFGRIHPWRRTPALATLVIGAVSAAYLIAMNVSGAVGRSLMADSFIALNLLVAFYYALTAFACVRSVGRSARGFREFVLGFALPLLGGVMLAAALIATAVDLAGGRGSSTLFAGIGGPLLIGAGSVALGVVMAICYRPWARDYFSGQTLPHDRDAGPTEG